MESFGRATRVRIYVNEDDAVGRVPAHTAIQRFLRRHGAQGATTFRGIEGFGAGGEVHVGNLVDVIGRLPLVVEWIDRADRVERLLPELRALLGHGFITADPTEIAFFEPPPVRRLAAGITAGDVLRREVVTVAPSAPLREVVELILGQPFRAVPVVERGRLVGIVTGSDLVERGGLGVRPGLLSRLGDAERERHLQALGRSPTTAADVMTRDPVTAAIGASLPEVALVMASRHLKRLPVVDEGGALAGIVSRVDLLRSVIGGEDAPEAPRATGLAAELPLASVLRRDAPIVHPETPLAETMQAVVSTRLNLAVVVDAERRVLGLVTDAELLERITPALRPGALRSLMHRLPFAHLRPGEAEAAAHARAQTAGELMSPELPTAAETATLAEATARMLRGAHKILAVTGAGGALVGVVDRADLLRGLASRAG